MNNMSRLKKKVFSTIQHFFIDPTPVQPLGLFRIVVAGFSILQVIVLLPDWMLFFGPHGLLPWIVSDALATKNTPSISMVAKLLSHLGISSVGTTYVISVLYGASLLFLLIGYQTRIAGIGAWLFHMMLNTTGQITAYGVETFTHIALFYCMVLPVGAYYGIDYRRGKYRNLPPYLVTLSMRVIQLHLCIMYFSSGIEKSIGIQWWNGEAIWIALQQDQFHQFNTGWMASVPVVPMLLGWGTVITEILYPFGMYFHRTKKVWLLAVIGMHLFIGIALGLHLFAALMILLNVSAFGYYAYPKTFLTVTNEAEH